MRRWALALGFSVCAATLVLWRFDGPRRTSGSRTGVFLIIADTFRADRLSSYGFVGHQTPNIDALAAGGALFERARSGSSWTMPSVAAIMTSRHPSQLGMIERPAAPGTTFSWREKRKQLRVTIPHEAMTLAEVLSQQGHLSAAFVNQPGLTYKNGFMQGFESWYAPTDVDEITRFDPDVVAKYQKWGKNLDHAYEMDAALVRRMDSWLASNSAPQVFAYLHLLTSHNPYLPPSHLLPETTSPSPEALYNAEIRAVDELVGEAIAVIAARIGLDHALIVFTADHGEAFGEHGMEEHGHSLHAEVTSVPLILSGPGVPAGARVRDQVSTLDVAPTVLGLLNVPASVAMNAQGRDLSALLSGGTLPPADDYCEGMLYGSSERALQRGAKRLLYDEQGDTFALFDLSTDPAEVHDLAGTAVEEVASMGTELEALHSRFTNDYKELGASVEAEAAAEDGDWLDALKALGYVDE